MPKRTNSSHLEQIIAPLLRVIDRKCPISDKDRPYELRPDNNLFAAELGDHTHQMATRVLKTSLGPGPLKIRLHTPSTASWFLIVDAGEGELDIDAARRQIASLIARLEMPDNRFPLSRRNWEMVSKGNPIIEIIRPLINLLNRKYSAGSLSNFAYPLFDNDLVQYPDEIIELPDDIENNDLAVRAIATLLRLTDLAGNMASAKNSEDEPLSGPLRLSLRKRFASSRHSWVARSYLVIDNFEAFLDIDGAVRQIVALVAYLEYQSNLIELSPSIRAMLI